MRIYLIFLIGFLLYHSCWVSGAPRLEKLTSKRLPDTQEEDAPSTIYKRDVSNILPLDLRSIDDWDVTRLLLISDIDGRLHGVDRVSGTLLWTLPMEEPIIKIQSNTSADQEKPNVVWFVEPYEDGSLYYFTPEFGLNKLPTSIKNLVLESPFSLNGDNKIYTGTRKSSLYTLNIHTGEVKSTFGSHEEKCPAPNSHYDGGGSSVGDTIMIGKTTYELTIHSKENANVVWNVTYSQWGPNNIDNDLIMQNQQSSDKVYFTPFHDKSLLAINQELGTPIWISKLPSLAVNVFDVFHNSKTSDFVLLPHPLKVLNNIQVQNEGLNDNNDLVFINKTAKGDEWFAMSFQNYPTLIKSAPISKYQMELYKLQNNINVDIESLRNFQLLKNDPEDVESFISGVHKIYYLTSETMYQPVSRLSTQRDESIKKIDEKETSHQQSSSSSYLPNIIDGIQFSNDLSSKYETHGLIEVDQQNGLIPKFRHDSTSAKRDLSLGRRIMEDFIVIIGLVSILLVFMKLSKLLNNLKKSLISEQTKLQDTKMSSSITVNLSGDEDNKFLKSELDDLENVTVRKVDNPTDSSDEKFSKSQGLNDTVKVENGSAKKVKIVIPNDDLEGDSDSSQADEIFDKTDSNDSHEDIQDKNIENVAEATKKKRKRGSRGGKRGGKKQNKSSSASASERDNDMDEDDQVEAVLVTKSLVKGTSQKSIAKKLQIENNLIISDKILGYGSHGTVVYQGTFENRPVAVKRMLLDFYDIASHEVRLLQESDDHPNVIRYFCSQSSENEKFLYIALELCLCSLEDIIDKPKSYPKKLRINPANINNVLHQLLSGLHYLHSLKIVHRDLKPQNILIADSKKSKDHPHDIRLLISDFGLCKKLDSDQSSFRATTQHAASGTSGWRAPELLLNHDIHEISPDTISSVGSASRHSNNASSSLPGAGGKRLTKAIDTFSMGCVFFYILTRGSHPFGDRYLREGNIIKGEHDLSLLKEHCPHDNMEAMDLVSSMINFNPSLRPNTQTLLRHPFFWSSGKKLEFLLKVSDRFEVEKRDPPSEMLNNLESLASRVHGSDWHSKFDEEFMSNLGKYRKYHPEKLMDLLRAIRNKYHHFNDMPPSLQEKMTPVPNRFYSYFNEKFPNLLIEVYFLVKDNLKDEHAFVEYF